MTAPPSITARRAASSGQTSGERRGRATARRRQRTTFLLCALTGIVGAASYLVHAGGVSTLERRAEQELTHRFQTTRVGAQNAIGDILGTLELLAGSEVMLSIFDADTDDLIRKELQNLHEMNLGLVRSECATAEGEVIASHDYKALGARLEPPADLRGDPAELARAVVQPNAGGLDVWVPVLLESRNQPAELIGYLRAHANYETLLVESRAALTRLVGAGGEVLAEVRTDPAPSEVADSAGGSQRMEFTTRTGPIDLPSGVAGPAWRLAITDGVPELALQETVMRRMVLWLAALTAALVVGIVLLFARFEGRLYGKLSERAQQLGVLNVKLERSREELVKAARLAGMSEVATGILHNVGNVLNSLNVASQEAARTLARSRIGGLVRLNHLLEEDDSGLATTIRSNPKGGPFVDYLAGVTQSLERDHERALVELACVTESIDHIKMLVSSQQEFARRTGVKESAAPDEILEGALVLCNQVLGARPDFAVVREFQDLPAALLDKHRILEILVNLVTNARQALDDSPAKKPTLTLRTASNGPGRLRFQVADNGKGIPREDLVRIFSHGFSTKQEGHGFGLHASYNAATELGGTLVVHSDGPGTGATFTLEVPFEPARAGEAAA